MGDDNYFDQVKVVWTPTAERVDSANITRFMKQHQLSSLDALRRRAEAEPDWFWGAVMTDLQWPFVTPYQEVLDRSHGAPWPQFFVGGQTNLALAAVDRHQEDGLGDKVAVIGHSESGVGKSWTYRELYRDANQMAASLLKLGVGQGTVVALYLPMIGEAVVAMLALAKIGAIFLPIFSGYGADAMRIRLEDAGASCVIAADGFTRRGRLVEMKAIVDEAVATLPQVSTVIVVKKTDNAITWVPGRDRWWADLLTGEVSDQTITLPADAPLMLLYTSGTTGKPKGAVHSHTGFPVKCTQDLQHSFDLRPDDVLFWFTDMGWMMGPFMVYGGLITGATIVLYDGTPDWPDASALWHIIAEHRVSMFGISPTVIRSLMTSGIEPLKGYDLTSLRILGSSGEPWNPEPWHWFFTHVGQTRCPIVNYSGGTEISGGILAASAVEPQKPCAFSGPIPGMAARVLNDQGDVVTETVGELALIGPWPGMTHGFWHDASRYLEAYWQRFEGIWVHGDFAYIDRDGFWYILGRSDDTIKVAGKRVGPAEVESILVSHPLVREAAAIGVPHPIKGESIVCFITAQDEVEPEDLLGLVEKHLGKALRPSALLVVPELPKTRNGKIVRRALKAQYLGRPLGDVSAIENLGSLAAVPQVMGSFLSADNPHH